MRLITHTLFVFFALLVGTAFGQSADTESKGLNEQDFLALVISVISVIRGLVWVADHLWHLADRLKNLDSKNIGRIQEGLKRLLAHEMFESNRVAGGTCGAVVAVLYLSTDVQVGPIVGLALFGGVLGTQKARVRGTIVGAILGLAIAVGGPQLCPTWELVSDPQLCPTTWELVLDPQLWFAVSLVPLGGLIAGKLWS